VKLVRSRILEYWKAHAGPVEAFCWLVFPATNLLSISAGEVFAVVLFMFWLSRARHSRHLPGAILPFIILMAWTLVSGIIGDPGRWTDAFGKWPVLFMAVVAWEWAASGRDIARPLMALFITAIALVPYEIWSMVATEYARARAFSGGAPNLGSNLMMASVFGAIFLIVSRGKGRKLVAVGLVACLAGLVLSYNRSALLGVLVALTLAVVPMRPVLVPAALAAVTFLAAVAPESHFALRFRSVFKPDIQPTSRERPRLWASGLRMVRDRPLAGFATRDKFQEQFNAGYRSPYSEDKGTPGHVHNSYIQSAVLHGIPGLGLVLWFLAVLWRNIRHSAAGERDGPWEKTAAVALAPLFIAVLVNSFFDFVFADGQRAMMFYTLTGLLLGSISRRPRISPAKKRG